MHFFGLVWPVAQRCQRRDGLHRNGIIAWGVHNAGPGLDQAVCWLPGFLDLGRQQVAAPPTIGNPGMRN